jgi:hypothetical protein
MPNVNVAILAAAHDKILVYAAKAGSNHKPTLFLAGVFVNKFTGFQIPEVDLLYNINRHLFGCYFGN